jgi:hypothetical protein
VAVGRRAVAKSGRRMRSRLGFNGWRQLGLGDFWVEYIRNRVGFQPIKSSGRVFFCFSLVIATIPAGLFDGTFHVPNLNANNFNEWKENLLFTLGYLELDLALRTDELPAITATTTTLEIAKHERWERSNRLNLMYMKSHIAKSIKGSILECSKSKDVLKVVEPQFVSSTKVMASTLMKRLSSQTFDSSKNVCEHIIEMKDIKAQLKSLEVEIFYSFLVHLILNSLPP